MIRSLRLILPLLAGALWAQPLKLHIDPAQTAVEYSVGSTLHTVHGTFKLKRGDFTFDPATGKASGELVVDAGSGESGSAARDRRMNESVLESARYPEIAFRPDRVEGHVPGQGSAAVQIHGTFLLHGVEHEITVPVQAELAADHWKGSGKFSVPYIEWGLKSPNNFFLKADKTVDVELELAGALERSTGQ